VVSGKILPLQVQPASLSPVVLTLEYQVSLTLELSARARDGREIKVDPREMRETERFLSSGDVEAQRKNRGEALQRVSRLLAARFLDTSTRGRRMNQAELERELAEHGPRRAYLLAARSALARRRARRAAPAVIGDADPAFLLDGSTVLRRRASCSTHCTRCP